MPVGHHYLPADRPVRFAVVGCGHMGTRHCGFIRSAPGAELVAVYDRDLSMAPDAAQDYQNFSQYKDLLGCPSVDAVVICLPSGLHAEFGIAAARAGKHVIVEKPIDASLAAARQLVAECVKAQVLCAVISQNRWAPGLEYLKGAIERQEFGNIISARASVKWYRHDEYYTRSDWRGKVAAERGGVLINQAIHSTDILLWLLGEPKELYAMTANHRPGVLETEDTAVACLAFHSGAVATLEASTSAAPGFDERYEIYGTKGSCFVEKGAVVFDSVNGLPVTPPPDMKPAPFHAQYQNLVAALRGLEPLAITPEEALSVMEITEAYYQSAHEHRAITF